MWLSINKQVNQMEVEHEKGRDGVNDYVSHVEESQGPKNDSPKQAAPYGTRKGRG